MHRNGVWMLPELEEGIWRHGAWFGLSVSWVGGWMDRWMRWVGRGSADEGCATFTGNLLVHGRGSRGWFAA